MRKFVALSLFAAFALGFVAAPAHARRAADPAQAPVPPGDHDLTLRAMHDEMQRSRTRLSLSGVEKPFYIEYRLLDLDVRAVTASFGALVSSTVSRSRYMKVDVRVGDYHLDSSNFVSEDGFQGFLGPTGQVGIDRDYNSLRQDLWLATDQAYKGAVTQMSLKQAFLRSLTKPPEIDDFSQAPPLVKIDPRIEPDWTSRNWDDEAREASSVWKKFPQLYGTRLNYYLIYVTSYLMNSEGTTIRESHTLAAVEAALDTQADDGMPLHNFYATYAATPSGLPGPSALSKALAQAAAELLIFRSSPLVPDYTGPVLFDAPAAASLLAQALEPSLSGARPPLSMTQDYDAFIERLGGRSEWSGRVGTRVLPASVSLVDDPTLKEFQGQPLLGGYDIDDEGVLAQRVSLVEDGFLRRLLMSRRPGPDFENSNGHARSALLSDSEPLSSNLIFSSSDELKPADLRKKFLDACRDDGQQWCLEVKQMDNPALAAIHREDFSNFVGTLGGGLSNGARMPLFVYKVYASDGHEEPVRGGTIDGLTLRSLRNLLGAGNDSTVYTYMQNTSDSLAGTALGAFGSAQNGIPSTVIAPSLLLDEVDVRGFHGEPRRLPLVSSPPLQ
ncbi:MAG TPA: metallopeptidase TldD-related protein [Candidatus Polarisedimenticolia bacterium]|nr:metallopeptidase TldD-related protein [Candidatus Polarisedimenticolia bacterium]